MSLLRRLLHCFDLRQCQVIRTLLAVSLCNRLRPTVTQLLSSVQQPTSAETTPEAAAEHPEDNDEDVDAELEALAQVSLLFATHQHIPEQKRYVRQYIGCLAGCLFGHLL